MTPKMPRPDYDDPAEQEYRDEQQAEYDEQWPTLELPPEWTER